VATQGACTKQMIGVATLSIEELLDSMTPTR
jgi:hypothetical protein